MTRILIIDDDPVVQLVLSRTLLQQGYTVLSASDGERGLDLLQEEKPELIICDWLLPSMDGLEICRRAKADPETATSFFILLTSRTEVEDRVQGLETGADEFLSKPIDVSELRSRVKAGLRLYQMSQQLRQLAKSLQNEKQKLEAELAEAAEYVRTLFPEPLFTPVQIHYQFLPSSQLGGDCFDFFKLDARHLVLYILDVSGHGIRSALLSVSIQNMLRTRSLSQASFTNPSSVLSALNSVFNMEELDGQYFTIWYGVYDLETRDLIYAGAGHPPAILIRESNGGEHRVSSQFLKSAGIPIGMMPDVAYPCAHTVLPPNGVLYLISDGIYDFYTADGSICGLDRFSDLLLGCHKGDAIDLDLVMSCIEEVNTSNIFTDDRSIIQVRLAKPE